MRGVDLVLLAVKAEAAVDTARDLREAIGSTPVLSVCAELSFGPGGVKPTTEATSIAQRIQDELDAPVAAGLHSLAASNLSEAPPDEDALVCGDDAAAKELALELAGEARLRPGGRLRPARERPRARGHDRGDRQREQALQGARGHPDHRPARDRRASGSSRSRASRRWRRATISSRSWRKRPTAQEASRTPTSSLSRRRSCRRRRAAWSVSRGSSRPNGRASSRRGRDPRHVEAILRESVAGGPLAPAARDLRDAARLRLRVGGRRRVEREGGGDARAPPRRSGCVGGSDPRRAARAHRPRDRRHRQRLVRSSLPAGNDRRRARDRRHHADARPHRRARPRGLRAAGEPRSRSPTSSRAPRSS